jgi:oligoendopeptidase F
MIMLNYTDTLNDVTTLAHEMGHAFHTELVYRHQNALDGDYGMLTAEVSSQFLEDYVYEVLLGEMDDHQRLSLQLNTLNDMISSIHRQIACYRFEQALHQEYRDTGWIPSERIAALFAEHMAAYMGDAVTHEPGSERRWVYRSHIRSYFYVFSYAGAMLLAQTLQTQVAAGELDFSTIIDKYYTIGRNQSPAQTFETLGIDITDTATWTDGLDAIRSQLHDAQALAAQLGYTT